MAKYSIREAIGGNNVKAYRDGDLIGQFTLVEAAEVFVLSEQLKDAKARLAARDAADAI